MVLINSHPRPSRLLHGLQVRENEAVVAEHTAQLSTMTQALDAAKAESIQKAASQQEQAEALQAELGQLSEQLTQASGEAERFRNEAAARSAENEELADQLKDAKMTMASQVAATQEAEAEYERFSFCVDCDVELRFELSSLIF